MGTLESHGRFLRRNEAGSGPGNRKVTLVSCTGQ